MQCTLPDLVTQVTKFLSGKHQSMCLQSPGTNSCSARLMTTSQEHCRLCFGATINIYHLLLTIIPLPLSTMGNFAL